MHRREFTWTLLGLTTMALSDSATAQGAKPLFDFTTDTGRRNWQPSHDITRLEPSREGMTIVASGEDPYSFGPPVVVPTGQPLWLRLRVRAPQSGTWQVFYFAEGTGATEKDSVRFAVRGGEWQEIQVPLPPLPAAAAYRFRLDTPPAPFAGTIAYLDVTPRVLLKMSEGVTRPTPPVIAQNAPVIQAGELAVRVAEDSGALLLSVAGQPIAFTSSALPIGYQSIPGGPLQWLSEGVKPRTAVRTEGSTLIIETRFSDKDGGEWLLERRLTSAGKGYSVSVKTRLSISQDRIIAHLPFLVLFTTEKQRGQAIFSGLEYLEAGEESGSEADLIGPEARRLVPSRYKITLPLMAMEMNGRYLGLAWSASPEVAAVFDTPDRHFGSGTHTMGLLLPGTGGMQERAPDTLLPYAGIRIAAGKTIEINTWLLGGRGTAVEAVRAYVSQTGLPPLPENLNTEKAVRLLATGWTRSRIVVKQADGSNHYRHAYPGDFGPHPAGDAGLCIDWLAVQAGKGMQPLSEELANQALAARKAVSIVERNFAAVGHIRTPAPALVYGGVVENLRRRQQEAQGLLGRFEADGSVHYAKAADRPDFGKTHPVPHANGLTGNPLESLLDAAVLTGDPRLIEVGLDLLRKTDRLYGRGVPRGAQTWEVPLHTPDILASAHLVRAFVLGYELTKESAFLEAARYWAWTGVPFVYLSPPVFPDRNLPKPIGLYGTTPVLGATNWEAPVWIGLPVQWCGLVYANALFDLIAHDPEGIWRRLAEGICISGLQQTWPEGVNIERQGLLPDSFYPPAQARNDVAINPATLQVPLARALNRPMYERYALKTGGPFVHAPGKITVESTKEGTFTFTVQGWPRGEYTVAVVGIRSKPRLVRVNGATVAEGYRPDEGWLLLPVTGKVLTEITL